MGKSIKFHDALKRLHFGCGAACNGELGWGLGIPRYASRAARRQRPALAVTQASPGEDRGVTLREYMAFYLMTRPTRSNFWHACGRLYEEWLCVHWQRVENHKLMWYRNPSNQLKIRADKYQWVEEAAGYGAVNSRNIGKRIILGSQFPGSPRNLQQLYQDGMANRT